MTNILLYISTVFNRVFILSIEASVLIVLILLVQYVCKRQLGIRWHYALWFILVAKLSSIWMPNRLFVPFEWFSLNDKLHISSLIESPEPTITFVETIAGESANTTGGIQGVSGDSTLFLTWTNIAIIAWLLGMLFLLSRIWIVHLRQASLLSKESVPKVPDKFQQLFDQMMVKLSVKRKLIIRQSNLVNGPSLFGLFKPIVLIPTYMLQHMSEDEFTYVIAHELSHYKRKDILVNTWCSLLMIIHWFNPLIWYGLYRMRVDQEMSCDAETIDYIGYEQKSKYATAIVNLIELGSSSRMISTQIGLFGYRNQMKRRIIMIKSLNRMKFRSSIIGSLAFLLLVAITIPQSHIGQAQLNKDLAMIYPAEGNIVSHYGIAYRGPENSKKEVFNDGIDIQNNEGTLIKAVAAGTITAAEYDPIHGNTITIRHDEVWETRYDHLEQIDFRVGTEVVQGQRIGQMGSTGASTGPHLHFAIKNNGDYVDPENLLISDI